MNPFYTVDGNILHNLGELAHALPSMSRETFAFHVTQEKNDFANWLASAYEPDFVERVRKCLDQQEMATLLQRELQQRDHTEGAKGADSEYADTANTEGRDNKEAANDHPSMDKTPTTATAERKTHGEETDTSDSQSGPTSGTEAEADPSSPASGSEDSGLSSPHGGDEQKGSSTETKKEAENNPAQTSESSQEQSHAPSEENSGYTGEQQEQKQEVAPQQPAAQKRETAQGTDHPQDESRYAPPRTSGEESGSGGSTEAVGSQQTPGQEQSWGHADSDAPDESRYAPPAETKENEGEEKNPNEDQESASQDTSQTTGSDTAGKISAPTEGSGETGEQEQSSESGMQKQDQTSQETQEGGLTAHSSSENSQRPQPAAQAHPLRLKTYGATRGERLHKHWLEFCYMIKSNLQKLRRSFSMPSADQVAQKKIQEQLPQQDEQPSAERKQEKLTDISRPTPPRSIHAPWIRAGYIELLAGTGIGIILGVVIAFIL